MLSPCLSLAPPPVSLMGIHRPVRPDQAVAGWGPESRKAVQFEGEGGRGKGPGGRLPLACRTGFPCSDTLTLVESSCALMVPALAYVGAVVVVKRRSGASCGGEGGGSSQGVAASARRRPRPAPPKI